jgi:hypothetical protein
MPSTYIKLASTTVGAGGASTITFSSIPQTYTDLVVKVNARGTNASTTVEMLVSFNGVSTNLSSRLLYGTGAAVGSVAPSNIAGAISAANDTASTFGNSEIYIPNYAGSTNKSVSFDSVSENNATTAYQYLTAGLWSNTSAITSVTLTPAASNFAQYSTATLYGVLKYAETGIGSKATGGTVTTSGGYTIHTFYSTGMFTPTAGAVSCDVLVVGGGGAGGRNNSELAGGGGGGAGGFRTSTGLSISAATAAIVGGGGAGKAGLGGSGTQSAFSTITSAGGGAGAGGGNNGAAGGSGGGAGYDNNVRTGGAGNTPSTSPSQGNGGGNNYSSPPYYSGGGGGASAAGANATSGANGAGGAGTANSYSGTSVTYAGGGGGSTEGTTPASGGAGGGGVGSNGTTPGMAGAANTGGGGGGGNQGGSGIVIVRYTT